MLFHKIHAQFFIAMDKRRKCCNSWYFHANFNRKRVAQEQRLLLVR
jgi:hypothetical protein